MICKKSNCRALKEGTKMNFVKINVVIDSKLEYWEVKLCCQKIILMKNLSK